VDSLAVVVTGGGVLAAALALARTRDPVLALGILLDLLTAAGLLRLTGPPDAARAAGAALVVLIRHVAGYGLSLRRGPRPGVAGPPRC
jgi:hypothetical protein